MPEWYQNAIALACIVIAAYAIGILCRKGD
jgi:hypothetical protein